MIQLMVIVIMASYKIKSIRYQSFALIYLEYLEYFNSTYMHIYRHYKVPP